ncbi:MAG: hypothetical protein Fur0021_34430 [Candidatus Promineifilaceae bacterium]
MRFKRPQPVPDVDGFVAVVPASAVTPGHLTPAAVQGRPLLLTRHEGKLLAFGRYCPHAAGDLHQGSVVRYKVVCPEHDYSFDMRTGRILWPEDEVYRLPCYEVKEEDGMVKVRLGRGRE